MMNKSDSDQEEYLRMQILLDDEDAESIGRCNPHSHFEPLYQNGLMELKLEISGHFLSDLEVEEDVYQEIPKSGTSVLVEAKRRSLTS